MKLHRLVPALLAIAVLAPGSARAADSLGFYRFPAIHGTTVVFTAEGDLWTVQVAGGVAQRLTSHPGQETNPAFSPDGTWIAYTGTYDGPPEAYVLPATGGEPKRLTWDGQRATVVGWTPAGEVMIATTRHSTLPLTQLDAIDPTTLARRRIPLAQAADGVWEGARLTFTRLPFYGSHTKRYRGGHLQQLWTWGQGEREARAVWPGDSVTTRNPMLGNGRLWFISDRDLTMNLWSSRPDGSDLRQATRHRGWDVRSAAMDGSRIVYQLGADLRVYDAAADHDDRIPIRLASDFDQLRERWVTDPVTYVTTAHLSPNGDRIVLTARGQVFVAPVKQGQGRFVEATRRPEVRWRQVRFMPDGKSLLGLSDASGEVEVWSTPANGIGEGKQLSRGGDVIRWEAFPSPDGKWIAHHDKNQRLWLLEVATGKQTRIAENLEWADIADLSWSPDSRWIAWTMASENLLSRIWLRDVVRGVTVAATTDRWDSYSPAWSPDGKWLWFLSDRTFESVVPSIWGSRQPDPFFDRPTRIYGLALRSGLRSPFASLDETVPAEETKAASDSKPAAGAKPAGKGDAAKPKADASATATAVVIDTAGLAARIVEVPVPAGNLSRLSTDGTRLFWLDAATTTEHELSLRGIAIERNPDDAATILSGVAQYELSLDRKKLLVRKQDDFYVMDTGLKAPELAKSKVSLAGWALLIEPRIEWQQMFNEGWRLERDYFYDTHLHGVDWNAVRAKYQPLAARVTERNELADVFQQMIGELVALHMYVRPGDVRTGPDKADPAALGAELVREGQRGWRVDRLYRTDPDLPGELAPLLAPGVDVREGDVVTAINGVSAGGAPDPGALLRRQAGKQVLLSVERGGGAARSVVVTPITPVQDASLRYSAWEYERRLRVDSLSAGRIGYIHFRAMGPGDIARWMRDYYPVFTREGLILDVRNNNGGNVDSWILGKLLRRAWFWWQPRIGHPVANMPFAFRGKIILISNERNVSDGEAFAEGFRRLGLGKIVGTRSLGGEIWLSQDNILVDRGIATAAETGVFAPEGRWLIENHGVDPDIVVDNLPCETFAGRDAQLEAAVRELLDELRREPLPSAVTPKYPDKSMR